VTAGSDIGAGGWAHLRRAPLDTPGSTPIGLVGMLDAVDVPIVVLSPQLTVTYFNHAAAESLGFAPTDIGLPRGEIAALGRLPRLEDWCAQTIASGEACRHDFRDQDKSYVLRIAPSEQTEGEIHGFVLTFANVTAFRASIDQAIYEREHTKTILNTVTDPLAVLDSDLRVRTANRAFYEMFRVPREAMAVTYFNEIGNHAFDLPDVQAQLHRLAADDVEFQPIEVDHDFPGMGRRVVSLNACRFSLPRLADGVLLLSLRDITEQRRAENEVRHRERRFRELIEALPAAVYTTDAEGRITFSNKAAAEFAGRQPELGVDRWSIGWRLFTLDGTPLPHDMCSMAVALREGRAIRGHETIAERPDGSRVTFVPHPTPLHDSSGALTGAVNVLVDITERKKAEDALRQLTETLEERVVQRTLRLEQEIAEREKVEAALRQSQKLEAIGHLTGGIAHDFNNLLMAILGSLEIARRRITDEAVRRLIDNAIHGAERGATLTQRMLVFARRHELNVEAVDIPSLVRGMTEMVERSLGPSVMIETRFPNGLSAVKTDPNQLEMALLNLMVNARDAMPQGGCIVVAARHETLDAGQAQLEPGAYVCLSVTDSGEGMDETTLAKAMDPFFTTKGVGKGTGLGLPMVHGLAQQSGGQLVLKSQKGNGATAEIWLPIAESLAPAVAQPVSPPSSTQASRRLTVLAVDDDPLVLTNMSAMLEDLGHTVFEANSARAALDILRREGTIELVLTDQAMPELTGLQLIEELKTVWPHLPVILATGFAELPAGTDPHQITLAKPFVQHDLAQALDAILTAPGSRRVMRFRSR
jgi:PAS domain S-box-containing protein